MKIERVTEQDYLKIYQFEKKNSFYFETVLPPRPKGYQHYDTFKKIMDDLMMEQSAGDYYMYLMKSDEDDIIGRINLQIIQENNMRRAELGYRTDFEQQGKGFTSEAVKFMLKEAFIRYDVVEVIAGTAKENIASQSVLEKNGFKMIGEEKAVMAVNGKPVDGIVYAIKK